MDNLNTHTPAALYEAFPPAEAKRLADKLEIHYTPCVCQSGTAHFDAREWPTLGRFLTAKRAVCRLVA